MYVPLNIGTKLSEDAVGDTGDSLLYIFCRLSFGISLCSIPHQQSNDGNTTMEKAHKTLTYKPELIAPDRNP